MSASAVVTVKSPAVAAVSKPSLSRDAVVTGTFTDTGVTSLDECVMVVCHGDSAPADFAGDPAATAVPLHTCSTISLVVNPDGEHYDKVSVTYHMPRSTLSGWSVGDKVWIGWLNTLSGSPPFVVVAGPFLIAP